MPERSKVNSANQIIANYILEPIITDIRLKYIKKNEPNKEKFRLINSPVNYFIKIYRLILPTCIRIETIPDKHHSLSQQL